MEIRKAITPLSVVALLATLAGGSTPAAAADPSPAPSTSPAAAEPHTTASGLRYTDVVVGTGPMPKAGQTVAITYAIFAGEKRLEGSLAGQPFRFQVGKDKALKGLDEGVSTMRKGGKRKLVIPPALAYGPDGAGNVQPNSTLLVDVELLDIQ